MKRLLLGCLLTTTLAACSSTNSQQAATTGNNAINKPTATLSSANSNSPAQAVLNQKIDANMAAAPGFIPFAATDSTLDPVGKGQILRQISSIQAMKKITLRGYCYRGSSSKAKSVAQARAAEVRDFLVAAGIPAKRITIRINTDKKQHGVQIASR
ncbi:OmpA family protein [Aquitalea sp. FJL05]|uniref:OmpA family protein n=1 Tax=Aquitalea sp. FJL05 TaxID=2153366 RepID=UPI0013155D5F|nr:OmpA family protein [Aquitalea sp. FJL05]